MLNNTHIISSTIIMIITLIALGMYLYILKKSHLTLSAIMSLIITVITSFPLFISTIQNTLNNFNIQNYYISKIIKFISSILNYLKVPFGEQWHQLIFTNVINIISSIIFFSYYFLIHKTNIYTINKKVKLGLLGTNIIVVLLIFFFIPDLDSLIS